MYVQSTLPLQETLPRLASHLQQRRVLVLSGAGISTESGIPDYRGPESSKKPRNPMRYQQFVGSEAARQRYWARSFRGWQRVHRARPNAGHKALARLETHLGEARSFTGLITQNVDGLHQAAGSRNVLELHGSLAAVRCLACRGVESRRKLQERMRSANPALQAGATDIAPDGDADVSEEAIRHFNVPTCERCGGVLKPDVVFFGENVPKARVIRAWNMFEQAEVLLVVGSSLTVFSGYRFVARAAKENKPVVIINAGATRGDKDACLCVDARLGEVLPGLVEELCA